MAEVISRYAGLTTVLLKSPNFCDFCYTQLTDMDQATNGLFTYDCGQNFLPEAWSESARPKKQNNHKRLPASFFGGLFYKI